MGEKLSANQYLILAFLFGLSYGIIIALNAARSTINSIAADLAELPFSELYSWPFQLLSVPGFQSPMFWVMPFVGFFGMAIAMSWARENLKTGLSENMNQVILLAFFIFLSLFAYYIALYWYIANFALLQGIPMAPELVDFWGKLHSSAFLLFFWGGVFGWIMRFAVEKLKI